MNHDNILAYLKVGFDCLAPIIIYSPEIKKDERGNKQTDANGKYICEYKYSFDEINIRVFDALLKSIGE